MAHVTLVRPPAIVGKGEMALYAIPPLGLAYIAGSVSASGRDCEAVDGIGEGLGRLHPIDSETFSCGLTIDEIVERIPPHTDVIGVTCAYTKEWPTYITFLQAIRRRFRDTPIVCGGEHITAETRYSMEACREIDYCILGEGEEAFIDLLGHLESNAPLKNVPGTAYRDDGQVIVNPRRPRVRNIDEIPLPHWDLFPIRQYMENSMSFGVDRGGSSIPLLASRGCPYQCTFCSSPSMWTTRWIARRQECVLDEMALYIQKYGVTNFDFFDLTAIVNKAWIVRFCQLLIAKNLNITWQLPSGTRSEALDGEVCALLYQSGCRNVSYSPESGSTAVIKRIKKKMQIPRVTQSIRSALKANLNVKANIVFGFPGETHREVWESLRFIFKLSLIGLHDLSIWSFAPYPGSELYRQLRDEGKIRSFDATYLDSISYSQVTQPVSWNENMHVGWINFYRIFGSVLFYVISYAVRPMRPVRIFINIYREKHESRMEKFLVYYAKNILGKLRNFQPIACG